MKIKLNIIIFFTAFFLASNAFSQILSVGLEPLPPLINYDKTGFSIDLLREIERNSDIEFKMTIMPYNRAKWNLKKGVTNMIGHTPHMQETEDFFKYAIELDWHIPAKIDIYSIDKTKLDLLDINENFKIGTPRGNEGFLSEITGIPEGRFYNGSIDNLLKMLELKRIDIFIFERSSTMTHIEKLKIKNIFYKNIDIVSAGFAVQNNKNGIILKNKLDKIIRGIDVNKIFSEQMDFINLPDEGLVKIKKTEYAE